MIKGFKHFLNEMIMDTHVTTHMRGQPLHKAHELVVNKVLNVAKKTGGSHSIILSHTHDNKKNPLHPSKKLKYAKKAFPNANVELASNELPSILHHAARFYQQGVKNLRSEEHTSELQSH